MQYISHQFRIMNLNHDMKCPQHIHHETCHDGSYKLLSTTDSAPCLVTQLRLPSTWNQHLQLLTRAQLSLLVAQRFTYHLYCHYCQEVILRFEQPFCHLNLLE